MVNSDESIFPLVVYFAVRCAVPKFESVDKILKCDHSNESY